jgi:hypothetical protein
MVFIVIVGGIFLLLVFYHIISEAVKEGTLNALIEFEELKNKANK